MVMNGDLTLGGKHTIQYTDDVLQNCTIEIYIILLANITPINSTKYILEHKEHVADTWCYLWIHTCVVKT